ncbi:MAG: hypothetical protein ACPLRA_04580, partial [Candidatus Saccharicenans sp.]
FDPEEAPPGLEDKILNVLQNLKSQSGGRQPVYIINKYVYRITEGYLEKSEKSGQPANEPEICWLEGESFLPLFSDFQVRNLVTIGCGPEILTEEQVILALKKMSELRPGKEFAYVASGFVFSLDKDGKLKASQQPAAQAFSWPLAHNVRPAQQALGHNGCSDCHSPSSNVFFGKVKANSPLKTAFRQTNLTSDLMKTGQLFQFLFGFSFLLRPAFKLVLAACVLVIGLILVVVLIKLTGKVSGISGDNSRLEDRR